MTTEPTSHRGHAMNAEPTDKRCVGRGEPARGYSDYCPDCHFDAFGGGGDIG